MRSLLPCLLLACATAPAPVDTTITTITAACVDGDALRVRFEGCLSSSCDTVLSAACTPTLAGDVLDVEGAITVRRVGGVCTDDCGLLEARCELPEGTTPSTTLLTFGGDDGGPVLEDAACADEG